jgi:hypothetical protein
MFLNSHFRLQEGQVSGGSAASRVCPHSPHCHHNDWLLSLILPPGIAQADSSRIAASTAA